MTTKQPRERKCGDCKQPMRVWMEWLCGACGRVYPIQRRDAVKRALATVAGHDPETVRRVMAKWETVVNLLQTVADDERSVHAYVARRLLAGEGGE